MSKLIGVSFIKANDDGTRFSVWDVGRAFPILSEAHNGGDDGHRLNAISIQSDCTGFTQTGGVRGSFKKARESTVGTFSFGNNEFPLPLPTQSGLNTAAAFFDNGLVVFATYQNEETVNLELLMDGEVESPLTWDVSPDEVQSALRVGSANEVIEVLAE